MTNVLLLMDLSDHHFATIDCVVEVSPSCTHRGEHHDIQISIKTLIEHLSIGQRRSTFRTVIGMMV